jgi:hypothetical protein
MPEIAWDSGSPLKPSWGMTASMVTELISMGSEQIYHHGRLTAERVYVAFYRGASFATRIIVAVALFLRIATSWLGNYSKCHRE